MSIPLFEQRFFSRAYCNIIMLSIRFRVFLFLLLAVREGVGSELTRATVVQISSTNSINLDVHQ